MTTRNSTNALAEMLAASAKPRRAKAAPTQATAPDRPVNETEQVAAAVDVLAPAVKIAPLAAEAPEVPHADEVVSAPLAEPTKLARTRRGNRTDLLRTLTERHRRTNKAGTAATRSVTITIPVDLNDRLGALSEQVLAEPTLGPGAHKMNRSALLEEAARRYAQAPARYPAVIPATVKAQPRLAGTVDKAAWDAMETAWTTDPNRAPTHGPHIAAAVEEILNEVSSALTVEHASTA
jgi:hypothetical protein